MPPPSASHDTARSNPNDSVPVAMAPNSQTSSAEVSGNISIASSSSSTNQIDYSVNYKGNLPFDKKMELLKCRIENKQSNAVAEVQGETSGLKQNDQNSNQNTDCVSPGVAPCPPAPPCSEKEKKTTYVEKLYDYDVLDYEDESTQKQVPISNVAACQNSNVSNDQVNVNVQVC